MSKPIRKREVVINEALVKKVQELEVSVEVLQREIESAVKFPAKIYKKLFPQAIDGPDGKWFAMDDEYSRSILKEIDRIKKGGKPEQTERQEERAKKVAAKSGWQPIETAPKDGNDILAFGMGMPEFPVLWDDSKDELQPMQLIIHWVELWHDSHVEFGNGGLFKKVRKPSCQYWGPHSQQFEPTHWMPLPKGPNGELSYRHKKFEI